MSVSNQIWTTSISRILVRAEQIVHTKRTAPPWICKSCRSRRQHQWTQQPHVQHQTRLFATSTGRRNRRQDLDIPSVSNGQLQTPAATSTALPSYTAKQRSAFSRRISNITDSILARASIAGQHINTYTGTDYSGIEALRQEILEQETGVRQRHAAVNDAKTRHDDARGKQATSQKEIVGLLERKSSWSPGDLERYMTLVRLEHVDDQAVQKATEELAVAERELEGTRSLLEKLERKQYHEEQIWSDTIRRNSTWVTIGLMGVNILLLLGQISIFEPYRRRKIVKQIKEVLDERSVESPSNAIFQQGDAAAEPSGARLAQLERPTGTVQAAVEELVPDMTIAASPVVQSFPHDLRGQLRRAQTSVYDLFSERAVQLKQIDITTVALEGAAVGAALTTAIALLVLRSTH